MKTRHQHIVRSPNCPNGSASSYPQIQHHSPSFGKCAGCAWGFLDHTNAQPLPPSVTSTGLGYTSDCGSVQVVVATIGTEKLLGAVRNDKFYPARSGNPAVERFVQHHCNALASLGVTVKPEALAS